ncbi:MAG: hypothetical protein NC311_08510 [Muribaculaceae bacterium]|nr:hypothetical protein [Muribaculaceae bacterium]
MHNTRRSITTNLLAIISILAIVLCLILGVTRTAECSETQVIEDAGIATAADTYEDFSSYTDQELPDKIDRNNIKQYVPIDKFNIDGTTVYNGRNYGFVIYSKTKTNHVLLFKEEYITHDDGEGYDVILRVVYENSFFRSGNTILNASSPYSISLSNIRINDTIFDSDMNNNITSSQYNCNKDSGAYFVQALPENKVSFYDKGTTASYAITVTTCVVSIGISLFCPPAAPALAIAGGTGAVAVSGIEAGLSVIGMIPLLNDVSKTDNMWVDTTTVNQPIDFPLTRQAQIEQCGGLRKNLEIEVKDDSEEYIGKNGDYTKASFRVMNDNNKDYYVLNRISFDIDRYNGAGHHKVDESSIESVYSVTGTDCDKYGQIINQDEHFDYESYYRIAPMAKSNLFNFVPNQQGNYWIMTPQGYYLAVDGVTQTDNMINVDENGREIGISSSYGVNIGDKLYSRLLVQDFYNGEIAFANISIQRDQTLNINEATQADSIACKVESSNTTHNDIYILNAGEYIDFIDLYITDSNLNVLAKAGKKDNSLYVNYPMKANEIYCVMCVNKSGAMLDLTVYRQSDMTAEIYPYSNIEGLYYSFTPKYNQFYNTTGVTLYDEDMNSYPSEGAFLQANQTYYLHSLVEENMSINLSEQTAFAYVKFGETVLTENIFNEMFRFTAIVTAIYSFADGTYDVYKDNALIAENVSQCDLYKDSTYLIVKRQLGGNIRVYIDGEPLQYGDNDVIPSYLSVYIFNLEEKTRLDITSTGYGTIDVYDEALNKIELDHGYLLEAGRYYIILSVPSKSTITIKEYLQEVNITFYVDGKVYNDKTGNKYYYGKKATLPVPVKDRYDFNGWRISNTDTLITDDNGMTSEELLVDEITLVAAWTLRSSVMEINFEDGTSKWWTGSGIVSQNPGSLQIEGEMIDVLVNMKDNFIQLEEGKKQGYFLSTFDYVMISSEGNVDYYKFTPVWEIEKYYIEFILPYGGISFTSRAVCYGEKITKDLFPAEAFEFDKDKELYWLTGWRSSANSSIIKFTLNNQLIDLTPGYGSEYNHASKGYGNYDSTLIRLNAELEYVDYTVIINSKSYGVGRDGYNIGTLGSYGYTESNYYGHNVLLTTPLQDKLFSFNGLVAINDLTSYWREGSRAVSVNLSLADQFIDVALSYNYSGSGNQTNYNGNQGNIALKSAYVRTYEFNYWTVDGNRIDVLNYANLGINQYYSVLGGVTLSKTLTANLSRESMKPTSLVNYTISAAATYVDLSRFSLMVGMTFTIASSAKEVTFVNGTCSDTSIIVDSRSSKLVINFDAVHIGAKNGENALDASACSNLELYSFSWVTLEGGEASIKSGGNAIVCKNLILLGNNFYIYGGKSLSFSYNGRAGIYCSDTDCRLTVSASMVDVSGGAGCSSSEASRSARPNDDEFAQADSQGKNGANGADGKDGTHGAVAIFYLGEVVVNSGCTLNCTGGAGGNGTNGSNGEKGGDGVNGALGKETVNPGNGGTGGKGGNGGNGGKPMICGSLNNNGVCNQVNGVAGKGGYNGYGAPAGKSSKTIWGNERVGSTGARDTDGARQAEGKAGQGICV